MIVVECSSGNCETCPLDVIERHIDRLACESVVKTILSLPAEQRPQTHLEAAHRYSLPLDDLPKAILVCANNKEQGICP